MDNHWIQEVLKQYERALLNYAYSLCGDLDRTRDVVQDTFIKLCKEDRQKVEGRLAQWLYTVCRNRIFEIYRKEKRMRPLKDSEAEVLVCEDINPAKKLQKAERLDQLQSLMYELNAKDQEVLRLKFKHGLSYKEISEITGMSVSHVGVLLHNIIGKLKRQVKGGEK